MHESSVFISKSHIMAVTLLSGGYIFYLMSTLDPTDPSLMAYLLSVILILVILLVTAPRLSWRYTLSPVHLSHGLLSHGPLPLVSFLSHGHIPVMAVRLLLREIMTRDRLDKGTVHQHLRHKDPGHPFLTLTTTTPSFPSL